MEFRPDGTIVVEFTKCHQNGEGVWTPTVENETVTLRRPVLEELFHLWEALDTMSTPEDLAEDAPRTARWSIDTMRKNAAWMREAVASLGDPNVYVRDGEAEGGLRLREDLAESGWMANGAAAARMLGHWQSVPLDPGSQPG